MEWVVKAKQNRAALQTTTALALFRPLSPQSEFHDRCMLHATATGETCVSAAAAAAAGAPRLLKTDITYDTQLSTFPLCASEDSIRSN